MTAALLLHLLTVVAAVAYFRARVERTFSVTGLALGASILVHGLPLVVYVLFTGPDTFIYEAALDGLKRDVVLTRLTLVMSALLVFMIAGCELANTAGPRRAARLRSGSCGAAALQPLARVLRLGGVAQLASWALALALWAVAVAEGYAAKIFSYYTSGESELGMILLRTEVGGSPYYLYNLTIASVAPFAVIAVRAALWRRPSPSLSLLLLLPVMAGAVLVGKLGTLSKAPPVIFLMQLLLLEMLLRQKRFDAQVALLLTGALLLLFLVMVQATIPDLDLWAAAQFLYYRVFDIPNEGVLEYLAAIPASIPHQYGGGMFALLRAPSSVDYVPMYFAVAEVTRGTQHTTSNALFIADAWAEFGWAGVFVFAVIAGFVVRCIDLVSFRHGESDLSACVVAGCSYGVFTMLSTSLPTALLTGGLAVVPLLALSLAGRPQHQPRLTAVPHPT
jgi:hypothetical protein